MGGRKSRGNKNAEKQILVRSSQYHSVQRISRRRQAVLGKWGVENVSFQPSSFQVHRQTTQERASDGASKHSWLHWIAVIWGWRGDWTDRPSGNSWHIASGSTMSLLSTVMRMGRMLPRAFVLVRASTSSISCCCCLVHRCTSRPGHGEAGECPRSQSQQLAGGLTPLAIGSLRHFDRPTRDPANSRPPGADGGAGWVWLASINFSFFPRGGPSSPSASRN